MPKWKKRKNNVMTLLGQTSAVKYAQSNTVYELFIAKKKKNIYTYT